MGKTQFDIGMGSISFREASIFMVGGTDGSPSVRTRQMTAVDITDAHVVSFSADRLLEDVHRVSMVT